MIAHLTALAYLAQVAGWLQVLGVSNIQGKCR